MYRLSIKLALLLSYNLGLVAAVVDNKKVPEIPWDEITRPFARTYCSVKVEELLQQGVDINAKNSHGYSLCHALVDYGSAEYLEKFLESGKVDVNAFTKNGYSCLHAAVGSLEKKKVELLLKHKARVDVSSWGTPLHSAVLCSMSDKPAVVKMLVDAGSDVNAVTNNGETPMDILLVHHHKGEGSPECWEIFRTLRAKGGRVIRNNPHVQRKFKHLVAQEEAREGKKQGQ